MHFYWDPPREAFTIPLVDLSIAWYGICFALGFVVGYFVLIPIARKYLLDSSQVHSFVDRLTWFVVIGTVVGARLGHVLFYDWPYYAEHPLEILMIRNGGLASHGGTLGIIIGLIAFVWFNRKRYPEITLLKLIDMLCIPTALTIVFIRLGNFFNQEIVGYETTVPWAVVFGHPAEGGRMAARHPAQLYEAVAYLATFILLLVIWKRKGPAIKPGIISGVFFIMVFGSRILIEFFKVHQASWLDTSGLQMGQYLSIPFVLLGIVLLLRGNFKIRFGGQV